jgi:pimeloyl-ACP methyl ester carboxylesterase
MQSYADWPGMVMPLINKLGLDSFDVLGMSAGAPYCYALAALLPGQVRRVFIYSGIPALLEAGMLDSYPDRQKAAEEFDFYRQADPADIAKALKEMYLAGLPGEVLEQIDFRDSMANGCLGMARETKLQSRDWGFSFTDIRQPVFMQHSKTDEEVPFAAALATSALLSDCELHVLPEAPHLSEDALLGFFDRMINRINEGQ